MLLRRIWSKQTVGCGKNFWYICESSL